MSHAMSVAHGAFGRAALYLLDRPIVTHAHREGHLIFHVEGTPAEVKVCDARLPCDERAAVAISPWEPHSFHNAPNAQSLNLVLYIKPMWFLENCDSAEFALNFGNAHLPVTPKIQRLIARLVAHMLQGEEEICADGLLYALTRACFDETWRSRSARGLAEVGRRFNDFRVRRSLRFMRDAMREELDIETVARAVGLSRPHFFKLFKQQMGVTPNIYVNTLRSEQAIEDLMTTEKTVTDIAHDLGFSSQASFTRFFSSNVGIAPSEYRRVAHGPGAGFPMMGQPVRLSGTPG